MAREAIGWFRWTFWYGWRRALRTVARRGPEVAATEGIPIERQRRLTLRLALGWGIPAYETYDFSLHRQPDAALDHVYDCETTAFHNIRAKDCKRDLAALFRDKQAAAEWLAAAGVPVVRTQACVPRGSSLSLESVLGAHGAIFCKMRSGSNSAGAFAAWRTPRGLAGRSAQGTALAGAGAIERAWNALVTSDDALVQPLLGNHPDMAPLASEDAAITLRYISQYTPAGVEWLCAYLLVPCGSDTDGQPCTVILPLDGGGKLLPLPAHFPSAWHAAYLEAHGRAPQFNRVPHWQEIADASHRAHQAAPELWGIAWDWVVTPDGPLLLEGNVHWELSVPQQFIGTGFLWSGKTARLKALPG